MATVLAEVVNRSVRVTVSARASATVSAQRSTRYGQQDVRFGVQVDTAASWVGYDYEPPLDVPITYLVNVGGTILPTAPVTLASGGRDWWVVVVQPSLSRPVHIESFPGLTYPLAHGLVQPQASRHPIAVVQGRRAGKGVLTLLTLTHDESAGFRSLVERSPFFLLNGPPDRAYPNGGLYLLAQDLTEQRTTRVAQEGSRRWVIPVQEVERPPLAVPVPDENTLGDWKNEGTTLGGWRARDYLDLLNEANIG